MKFLKEIHDLWSEDPQEKFLKISITFVHDVLKKCVKNPHFLKLTKVSQEVLDSEKIVLEIL